MPVLHINQVDMDRLRTIKRAIEYKTNCDITDAETVKQILDCYERKRRGRSQSTLQPPQNLPTPDHDQDIAKATSPEAR